MKRKNLEKCLKKTIAMALTLTLTVPMTMPAVCVDAQEVNVQENDVQEMEALADLQLEENDVEVVDIKYSTSCCADTMGRFQWMPTAMLIYKVK